MYTMRHKFGIFITCYKDTEITTLTTMKNIGYKGPIRLIVGTDDPKLEEFNKLYGDLVYVFDKKDIEKRYNVDLMLSNSDKIYNIIIFAKFACYECAKEMGLDYWQQLDDDYTGWSIRHVEFEPNTKKEELKTYPFRDADTGKEQVYEQVVDLMIDVLDSNPKFCCIAFAQAGDFIGGASSFYRIHGKRKVMNTIITKVNYPGAPFRGLLNDDVNYYLDNGRIGNICLTNGNIMVSAKDTQLRGGGLADAYLSVGTYFKSFFSVIINPSGCKIGILNSNKNVNYQRIHHTIDWNKSCPKIISDQYKVG